MVNKYEECGSGRMSSNTQVSPSKPTVKLLHCWTEATTLLGQEEEDKNIDYKCLCKVSLCQEQP